MSWPAWRVAVNDDPDPRHSGDSFRYDCQRFRTALTVSGNRWEEKNETQGIVALAIAAGTIVASLGVIATPQAAKPHGESEHQTAEVLNCSVGAVKALTKRAMEQLRANVGSEARS